MIFSIESSRQVLNAAGIADACVHFELFNADTDPSTQGTQVRSIASNPPAPGAVTANSNQTAPMAEYAAATNVTIIMDGTTRQIHVDAEEETVLSAARRQGLDLPFSCAGGMCCTCRCKVVSGEGRMDLNYSLQAWEIEAGFTLACQTRPVSASMVLDFDAS